MVGKWHLCPTDEMNLASTRRNWPSGRGLRALVRVPRRGDEPVVPGARLRQPPGRPAARRRRRATTSPTTSRTRRWSSSRTRRRSRRTSRSSCTTRRAPPTRRTTRRRSGSRSSRGGSTWATRRCASRRSRGRRRWASSRRTPSCRRSTRSGRPRRARAPTGSRSRSMDTTKPWDSLSDDEKRLFSRMAEVYAGFLAHADHHIGRLLDYLEFSGQRENTIVILVSDNGASGEGGPERLGEREPAVQRDARRPASTTLAMLDELGGPKTYNHYSNGWAMAFNTPFKMWKRYEFNGGTSDPCIISWPAGDGRPRASSGPSTTTRSTSCRRSSTASASRPPRRIKGHVQSSFDGVSMRYSLDDASAPSARTHAVLLDARVARDLARRMEGDHDPPDDRGLEQLQRRRVGAVPHRRRPLRAARPGGRGAREAPRARQPVVRRGGPQRRVPARRPLGARDHPDAAAPARRPRTATSTSRTPPTSRSSRRSTSATARTRSGRSSTSPARVPRASCSPTARASAATRST